MRAFGPGSISAFLKTTLDVAYALLWVAAGALAISAAAALLWQPFLGPPPPRGASGPLVEADALLRRGPALLLLTLGGGAYLGALTWATDRLRRLFGTMAAGDPFEPANVRRLRQAGVALILLQLSAYAVRPVAAELFPQLRPGGADLNLSGWFAILVVFVLAEVFREGARLREEAELTV